MVTSPSILYSAGWGGGVTLIDYFIAKKSADKNRGALALMLLP